MRLSSSALLAAAALALVVPAARAEANRLAPVPREQATVVHGPFEQGACDACHARADQRDPGPAAVTKETCLACHDEFGGKAPVRIGKGKNHPVKGECTGCHNPHNSTKRKLLL